MQTTPYDASIGHAMSSLVNVSTASGTNSLHGETYWFGKNSKFDAANFFNNKNATQKPNYKDNRYGASVGGPVIIPGLYNGRNKTFFHYVWEANKWTVPQTFTGTVPTEAQRRGDFSQLLGARAELSDLRSRDDSERRRRAHQPSTVSEQRHPTGPPRRGGPEPRQSLSAAQPPRHRRRPQQLLQRHERPGGLLRAHGSRRSRVEREPSHVRPGPLRQVGGGQEPLVQRRRQRHRPEPHEQGIRAGRRAGDEPDAGIERPVRSHRPGFQRAPVEPGLRSRVARVFPGADRLGHEGTRHFHESRPGGIPALAPGRAAMA